MRLGSRSAEGSPLETSRKGENPVISPGRRSPSQPRSDVRGDPRGVPGWGPAEATVAFGRIREELEAHFEKEDRLDHPAIRALRPDRAEAADRVGRAHEQFIRRFDLIVAQLRAGKLDEAKRSFEEFAEAFIYHEIREEDLIRSLDKEFVEARR